MTTRLRRLLAAERGAAGLLVLVLATLVVIGCLGLLAVVVDLGTAAARARTAADAAALAGMGASPLAGGDGDPRRAASALARANAATLLEVDDSAWPLRIEVLVEAQPHLPASRLAPPLRARAAAQLRLGAPPLD